jgi:hypothetical protein
MYSYHINCVKIVKNDNVILAPLTLAFGVYVMRKSNVFNDIRGSRKYEKVCKMTLEVRSQERKGHKQMWPVRIR